MLGEKSFFDRLTSLINKGDVTMKPKTLRETDIPGVRAQLWVIKSARGENQGA